MKIATQPTYTQKIGYQLILDDRKQIIGINLMLDKKILSKKRYDNPLHLSSQNEINAFAKKFVKETINNIINPDTIINTKTL